MKPYQKFMTGALAALFLTSPLLADNMKFPQKKNYGLMPAGSAKSHALAVKTQFDNYVEKWYNEDGYVYSTDTHNSGTTVSEAHGYGMIIFAIMNDKVRFDKMVSFYERNKVVGSLMQWRIGGGSWSPGSATDGDLDIAYALLLADQQWGGNGYKDKAISIINDIKQYDLNGNKSMLALGSGYSDRWTYRPSDLMAGHMRAFDRVDNGFNWGAMAEECYNQYFYFQDQTPSTNGLISDFVNNGTPAVQPGGAESPYDKDYFTNAARVPLRFAMDYARNDSQKNRDAISTLMTELLRITGGDASKIVRGYKLDGSKIGTHNGLEWLAPYGAGLIATDDRNAITSAWNEMQQDWTKDASATSFGDALKLLSMIVMSGNWWTPGDADSWTDDEPNTDGVVLDNFGNAYGDDNAQAELGAVNGLYWGDNKYGGTNGDSTFYHGGGYWYCYAGAGAAVKSADGELLSFEETPEKPSKMDLMVKDNRLDITFDIAKGDGNTYDYAALEVPFISDITTDDKGKTTSSARYVDLTAMTGVTIQYQSDKQLVVVISTKDQLETVAAKDGWIGNYQIKLPAQPEMKRVTFPIEDLLPEAGSPLEAAVKANKPELTGLKDAKAFVFQAGEGGSKGDDGLVANLKVEDIILNGLEYSAFGVEYRKPTPVAVTPGTVKQTQSITTKVTANNIALQFPSSKAGAAAVALYTVSGRQVAATQTSVTAGMNSIDIDTRNLATGIYLMRLNVNGAVSSAQISLSK